MNPDTVNDFIRGCREYVKHEKRDPIYRISASIISRSWGNPQEVADGLNILLLVWNQAFYRYGPLDFERVSKWISDNQEKLNMFRQRDILTLSQDDIPTISDMFNGLLEATRIETKKGEIKRSPVAVAKALHLLAPRFFPLWDMKIAKKCGHYWYDVRKSANSYIRFFEEVKIFCTRIEPRISEIRRDLGDDRSLVKLVDEYYYAKYTQGWI